jgi:hypothetical protein
MTVAELEAAPVEAQFSDSLVRCDFPDQNSREISPSLPDQSTLVDAALTTEQAEGAVSSVSSSLPLAEGPWQLRLNQSMRPDSSETSQINGHSGWSSTSTIMGSSSLPQQTPLPLPPALAQGPMKNDDGKMICNYLCSDNRTFERRSGCRNSQSLISRAYHLSFSSIS